MGFLCCRRKTASPATPSPASASAITPSPPKRPGPTTNGPGRSHRRRSAPRPRASRQNIEQFYREGKELLRAEQEQQERNYLRAVLRQQHDGRGPPDGDNDHDHDYDHEHDYDHDDNGVLDDVLDDFGRDEDAVVIKLPLGHGFQSPMLTPPNAEGAGGGGSRSAADSMNRGSSSRYLRPLLASPWRWSAFGCCCCGCFCKLTLAGSATFSRSYSFETTTDRMAVRMKNGALVESDRSELLSRLHSNENLQYAYRHADDAYGSTPPAASQSGRREYRMSGAAPYPTDSDSSSKPSTLQSNNPNAAPYHELTGCEQEYWPGDPDQDLTPKASRMLRNVSDVPPPVAAVVPDQLPRIDADDDRATTAAALAGGVAAAIDRPQSRPPPPPNKNRLGFPSEEIFARLPSLLKSSTSTFFGSNASHAGRGGLSSPASDETALHHRFSQQSLRPPGPPSKKPSLANVTHGPRRIDSSSSFYPSPTASQCQSLQESQLDFAPREAAGANDAQAHASTMPRMYKRRSMDRLYRVRSSSSFGRADDSPGLSRFSFPWNGGAAGGGSGGGGEASPARTLVRVGSVAEIVPEEESDALEDKVVGGVGSRFGDSSLPSKKKRKGGSGPRPQKRSSSSRAITGMINFVKAGVTGEDYSSSSSGPHSSEDLAARGPRTAAAAAAAVGGSPRSSRFAGRPSSSSRSKGAVRTDASRYSSLGPAGARAGRYPDRDDWPAPRRSISLEGRPSGLRHVASRETELSQGRFDHIEDSASVRSRKPTLRKSFTNSMLKIKEKVSIGGFRAVARGGGAASGVEPGKQQPPTRAGTLDNNTTNGIVDGGYNPSFPTRLVPIRTAAAAATTRDRTGATPGAAAGRTGLRRSNTAPSRRPSTSGKGVYNTRRSTAYDDCVIFPFAADGGDDDEEGGFVYADGHGLRPPSFQMEEYAGEREFWRSRSAVDVSAVGMSPRRGSIGMAH